MEQNNMLAMILAGGRGTRFKRINEEKRKTGGVLRRKISYY
ncbi:MAG: hypothetical protein ACOX1W_00020 [Catenisphaera adipataccumulans]